jgi:hypothetical protein
MYLKYPIRVEPSRIESDIVLAVVIVAGFARHFGFGRIRWRDSTQT